MSGRNRNVFVSVILFSILNLQMCCGNYDCYRLSSGKNICFMFHGSLKNFEASKLFCQNNGGFLLEIYNEEMQLIVETFGRNNNLVFTEVWLNLLRTNTNVWLWGGEGSGIYMRYSNWEFPPTYTEESNNNAVLENNYKWIKTYDSRHASTICIQGSRKLLYLPGTSTLLFGINTIKYRATTTKLAAFTTLAWIGTRLFYGWTTSGWMMTTKETITTAPNIKPPEEPTRSAYTTSTSSLNWYTLSESSTSLSPKVIGIGVGVGLGGLVLIIVSSLLIAKFVFHKEIPLPFKSSRSRNSPPHQTGPDVSRVDPVYDGYEQIDENKIGVIQNSSGPRSIYAEVTAIPDPHEPPTYNNNVNNSSNKKVLEYADLGRSSPLNSMQEPERIAAPNGTLYTKTFEKMQNENLTAD